MYDKKLVKILNNIAVLLDIKGENPFKSRAYSNAAEIIESGNLDVRGIVSDGTIADIKGFGDALQKKLTEYVETGKIGFYENLIKEVPETLVEVKSISSIGAKKAKLLWDELGITNLDELEQACIDGSLLKLKGFTAKTLELILNSIQHRKAAKGKHLQEAGLIEAEIIKEKIYSLTSGTKTEFTGVMRRFDETYELIEMISTGEPNVIRKFVEDNFIIKTISKSEDFIEFLSPNEIPYRVYFAKEDSFGSAQHKYTGTPEYLKAIDQIAERKGINLLTFNFASEKELFYKLGLQLIPPELREDAWAVEASSQGNLPKLIERSDLRGMLHVHSTWSDGKHSIKEMALSAKNLGFSYIAICDHSRSAAYANGLDIERIKQQHDEIDRLNTELEGITILKGTESDILPNGSLDYPDSVLGAFDLVVASVHSGFNQSRQDMSRRMIYALMSPYTDILGHPTGRLLTAREAYKLDIEEVIAAAAEYKKIIEINCNPYRLDLSWRDTILAKEAGVAIAINPDSHHKDSMSDVDIGIKAARKGRLERQNVVNCLDLPDFIKFIGKKNF